ncbi:hypothetical protein MJG53_013728 [Ovis ammon polii x Ovis aries]|uniref:Uncharacterized protein n=1 Tax=Ovis ammon polii x Ovis aries TaxID=2918886 RepID=A0ACB9UJB7_9CETA|nr:hypothetical protein MJG53_013728 [Ovis ammon polii x Ovis aries]
MTRAGALLLLCAALLLITGGKCDDICPALRDIVDLFISGSHEAYIEQVEKYNQNPDVLETADTLKSCVDERLTAEDKQDALSALAWDPPGPPDSGTPPIFGVRPSALASVTPASPAEKTESAALSPSSLQTSAPLSNLELEEKAASDFSQILFCLTSQTSDGWEEHLHPSRNKLERQHDVMLNTSTHYSDVFHCVVSCCVPLWCENSLSRYTSMTWAPTRTLVAAQAAYPDRQVSALAPGKPQSFSGCCSAAAASFLQAVPIQGQAQ